MWLWLGFTLAPLSQILCYYLLGHISTYLHIYTATLCLPGTRRGWACVLTAYKDPQTSDLPTGLPSASVGTRAGNDP